MPRRPRTQATKITKQYIKKVNDIKGEIQSGWYPEDNAQTQANPFHRSMDKSVPVLPDIVPVYEEIEPFYLDSNRIHPLAMPEMIARVFSFITDDLCASKTYTSWRYCWPNTTKEDLVACSRVCKAWRYPAQSLLFRHAEIFEKNETLIGTSAFARTRQLGQFVFSMALPCRSGATNLVAMSVRLRALCVNFTGNVRKERSLICRMLSSVPNLEQLHLEDFDPRLSYGDIPPPTFRLRNFYVESDGFLRITHKEEGECSLFFGWLLRSSNQSLHTLAIYENSFRNNETIMALVAQCVRRLTIHSLYPCPESLRWFSNLEYAHINCADIDWINKCLPRAAKEIVIGCDAWEWEFPQDPRAVNAEIRYSFPTHRHFGNLWGLPPRAFTRIPARGARGGFPNGIQSSRWAQPAPDLQWQEREDRLPPRRLERVILDSTFVGETIETLDSTPGYPQALIDPLRELRWELVERAKQSGIELVYMQTEKIPLDDVMPLVHNISIESASPTASIHGGRNHRDSDYNGRPNLGVPSLSNLSISDRSSRASSVSGETSSVAGSTTGSASASDTRSRVTPSAVPRPISPTTPRQRAPIQDDDEDDDDDDENLDPNYGAAIQDDDDEEDFDTEDP